MSTVLTLRQLLAGYTVGETQSAGIMRVVPLLADREYAQVGDMADIYLKRDEAYETFLMASKSDSISVIPHGLMYVVAEKAQDRAIPSAHLIAKEKRINVNCLQPSQGGYMAASNREREWGILPRSLKESAWSHKHEARYDALWGDIERFLQGAGLRGREIVQFFKQYKDELETFVAQFEPVRNQLGAIFILNNVVVGVEIVPTYKYWSQMWRPLVRDCYGSEAVVATKKGYARTIFRPMLKVDEVNSFEDIEKAVDDLLAEEKAFTNEVISDILDEDMNVEQDQILEDFTLYNLMSGNLMGQRVMHGPERTVYLSLITRFSEQIQQRRRQFDSRWNTESPYASDQEFTLEDTAGQDR